MVEKLEADGQRQLMWLAFDQHNGISSGIRYGSRNGPAPALEEGALYRVSVGTVIGGDAARILAVRDFSP